MRRLIFFLSLALVACSPLRKTTPPQPGPPAPRPAQVLAEAERLEESGNYGRAIALLSDAMEQFPDDEELGQALSRVRSTWEPRRQELEDRLLIVHVESLNREIPLQQRLLEGDPSDRLIKDQIEYSQRRLERTAELLAHCGKRQAERRTWLARRCLSLSLDIRGDAEARSLLSKLESRRESQRAWKSRQQQLKRSEAQQALAASHLQRALALTKGTKYQAANSEIEVIATIGMADLAAASESGEDRQEIRSRLTDQLLVLADNLYRTGQIEPAIACWQAVLALDPTLEQAGQKMVRAQKVMDNLNTLRRQSDVDAPEGSGR